MLAKDIEGNEKIIRNAEHRNTKKNWSMFEDIWGNRNAWKPRLSWKAIDELRKHVVVYDLYNKPVRETFLSIEALTTEAQLNDGRLKTWREREKADKEFNCLNEMTVVQLMHICEVLNVSPEEIVEI